jgi:hypothetical protein
MLTFLKLRDLIRVHIEILQKRQTLGFALIMNLLTAVGNRLTFRDTQAMQADLVLALRALGRIYGRVSMPFAEAWAETVKDLDEDEFEADEERLKGATSEFLDVLRPLVNVTFREAYTEGVQEGFDAHYDDYQDMHDEAEAFDEAHPEVTQG